jgi:hypothetical protein
MPFPPGRPPEGFSPTWLRMQQAQQMARTGARHPVVLGGAIAYYVLVGGPVLLIQAVVNGASFDSSGAFVLYVLAALFLDAMRVVPLIVLRHSRYGLLHPLVLIFSIWPIIIGIPFLGLDLAPLVGLFTGESVGAPYFLGGEVLSDSARFMVLAELDLLEALGILTTVFVFTLCERHYHASGTPDPRPAPNYDQARLKWLLFAAAIAATLIVAVFVQMRGGLTAHILSLSGGRFVALQGYGPIVALSGLGIVAVYVWVFLDPRSVRTLPFIAAVMLAAFCGFVSTGSRGAALLAVVGTGLCWTIRTKRFPIKTALVLIPMLLVIYGGLLIVRSYGSGAERSATVYDRVASIGVSDAYQAGSDELAVRMSVRGAAPVLSEGLNLTGGPLWGKSYLAAITWFVPRAIWPEKPRGAGSLYAQTFMGALREGTSVPIGTVAEAYWNFWIPGVFVIFGLWGLIIFWAHRLFLIYGADPFVGAAYVIFITRFGMASDRIPPTLQMLLMLLIIWSIARMFATGKLGSGREPITGSPNPAGSPSGRPSLPYSSWSR